MPPRSHEPAAPRFHAWDPGLEPGLPRAVRPLASVFRPENVELPFREIAELADASGLPAEQLAPFKAERLVAHEVMIRVMADLSVPIGAVYADHGVNFRRIVATILRDGIADHLREVAAKLRAIRAEADDLLEGKIAALLDDPPPAAGSRRGFFRRPPPPLPRLADGDRQAVLLRRLAEREGDADSLANAVREALHRVATGVIARHGMMIRDRALLRRLAGILVSNDFGSRRIGEAIEPFVERIAVREGYRRLTPQSRPVVMNVKGASASGKSTIRPHQRELAERIGAEWADFAVITPDVWRKFLLDYDSLGEARRYAGPLTGYEVAIIDAKLDRYMARKAAEARMPHLLIDRFRFDSFAVEPGTDAASQFLTRFGHRVYLQFMVTPPEATVERAWKRGEQFGRYKAVEDLLAHNVEAFGGMPRLFFLWVLRRDKAVFFEFLDNSVPEGSKPETIAFGTNGNMTILDPQALLDLVRFHRIDIHARSPEAVRAGIDPAAVRNAGFLQACLARLPTVRFAERETGCVYARVENGTLVAVDRPVLARVCRDAGLREALQAVDLVDRPAVQAASETVSRHEVATLGAWGPNESCAAA